MLEIHRLIFQQGYSRPPQLNTEIKFISTGNINAVFYISFVFIFEILRKKIQMDLFRRSLNFKQVRHTLEYFIWFCFYECIFKSSSYHLCFQQVFSKVRKWLVRTSFAPWFNIVSNCSRKESVDWQIMRHVGGSWQLYIPEPQRCR